MRASIIGLVESAEAPGVTAVKVEIKRAGAKSMEPADLKKIAALLREANYQGWVALEYESKPDPFTAIPEHLKALRAALG